MAQYRTCKFCGCSLDPEERCDCMDDLIPVERQNNLSRVLAIFLYKNKETIMRRRASPRKEVRKNEQSKIELSCGSVLEP